ncbi:hypothetical protein CRE_11619 [Caenorhabditis remanei]|uniref:Uncharacterized protein n=1 Tax=Caenorhabditis remanei TaxID=31234 RepID=E3NTV9_CAERE|nr:hypothetical protein CRE_11619 [Caenorhabditis remanei]
MFNAENMKHNKSVIQESKSRGYPRTDSIHKNVETKTLRLYSSENNFWNPANLITNTCYSQSGLLLSRRDCTINLHNKMKSKKHVDFYEILKMSSKPGLAESDLREIIKCLAFSVFYMQKNTKKREIEDCVKNPFRGFDLKEAKSVDREIVMPSGKSFFITASLTPTVCSTFCGKMAVEKVVANVMQQISICDEWFLIYGAPETGRSTKYIKIGNQFFDNFSKVIRAGFQLSDEPIMMSSLVSHIRSSVQNFMLVEAAFNV